MLIWEIDPFSAYSMTLHRSRQYRHRKFAIFSVVITLRVMFRRRRILRQQHSDEETLFSSMRSSDNSPAAKHHAERDDYTWPASTERRLMLCKRPNCCTSRDIGQAAHVHRDIAHYREDVPRVHARHGNSGHSARHQAEHQKLKAAKTPGVPIGKPDAPARNQLKMAQHFLAPGSLNDTYLCAKLVIQLAVQ